MTRGRTFRFRRRRFGCGRSSAIFVVFLAISVTTITFFRRVCLVVRQRSSTPRDDGSYALVEETLYRGNGVLRTVKVILMMLDASCRLMFHGDWPKWSIQDQRAGYLRSGDALIVFVLLLFWLSVACKSVAGPLLPLCSLALHMSRSMPRSEIFSGQSHVDPCWISDQPHPLGSESRSTAFN